MAEQNHSMSMEKISIIFNQNFKQTFLCLELEKAWNQNNAIVGSPLSRKKDYESLTPGGVRIRVQGNINSTRN